MDDSGNFVAQVVAVRYKAPFQYFAVPHGLSLLDTDQVSDYWIHNEVLRIRLAKDFVQSCPKQGCDVIHGKNQVVCVDAFESIEASNPGLTSIPNDIDIVEKTTDHLRRLHNRVNVVPAEAHVPVADDFPHWNKIAAGIFGAVDHIVLEADIPAILASWTWNVGDAIANVLGFSGGNH